MTWSELGSFLTNELNDLRANLFNKFLLVAR